MKVKQFVERSFWLWNAGACLYWSLKMLEQLERAKDRDAPCWTAAGEPLCGAAVADAIDRDAIRRAASPARWLTPRGDGFAHAFEASVDEADICGACLLQLHHPIHDALVR